MAIGATMYNFEINLADVDRGVYEDLALRLAQHPSETDTYMLTRLLAYCLEHEEGITFSTAGLSANDEPAVLIKDLTGHITAWVEVGAPDAERLHYGSKLADRAVLYTHRDPAKLIPQWEGKTIHQVDRINGYAIEPEFLKQLATALERRNTMTVSRTEGELYVELNGENLHTAIQEFKIQE